MDEPATRSTERTRRAILSAATDALQRQGTGVALSVIARQAGVTKSGLQHHFPSRNDLLFAVAQDALEGLRVRVHELVDLSENHPGKMLRAYVRALFEDSDAVRANFDHVGLWAPMLNVPGVEELLDEDTRYWREQLSADGIHADRVLLVRHTAESFAASRFLDPDSRADDVDRARSLLLWIADGNGPMLPDHVRVR